MAMRFPRCNTVYVSGFAKSRNNLSKCISNLCIFHQHNYAPSRIPTRIHPAPIIAAPSHHSPPTASWKITIPSNAVIKKLAEVFVIETFVVEGPAVRARVNRAHMMMLQRTLRPRQSYIRTGQHTMFQLPQGGIAFLD